MSRAQVAMWILNGAQNADAAVVANKVEAATYFTNGLDKGAIYVIAYNGDDISEAARALLGRITATTDMLAFKTDIDAFLERMIRAGPGLGLPVTRYSGFNYLQDMEAGPAYSAKYVLAQFGPGATSGSVTYGEQSATIDLTIGSPTGVYLYGAPVNGSENLLLTGVQSTGWTKLPHIAMLCSSVSGSAKSTDILLANSAVAVTDAHELVNQTLSVYREDCTKSSSAGNTKSFSFDAAGNGVVQSQNGMSSYSASAVNQILAGQLLYDVSTKKYWTYKFYKFLKQDGTYSFAIVQHQGDFATGVKNGSLGLWTQQ